MLDERARELSWEAWRRNDLIRFGRYEAEYPLPNDVLKMDKSSLPPPLPGAYRVSGSSIPTLQQNPGY
ncbi:MAG: hypothetical protein WKG07_11395 [Hymenobacter sp.]